MRHARFDVAAASLDRSPLRLKAAYLLVAEADQGELPHWECLTYTFDTAVVPQGTFRVDLTTLDGRYLMGEAALVRSVDGAHVLRGTGVLHGITDEDLGPPE